ncbi:hypothetical protein ABTX77_40795 [Streptomyces sp. NPDC097704]|uniref:hypothetical protein n=1 Tax=Streptomyces sp. NPDC097704 TaxID=3157101 RepID=UPI00332E7CEC
MSRSRTTLDTTGPDHPAQDRIPADYQNLLRVPGFWRMAVISMTSKPAASMTSLSLLLLVSSSHSYGTAGLAVGCSTLGEGLTAPLRGRLIDRLPVRPVLFSCLAVHLAATIAVITAVQGGADATLICTMSAAKEARRLSCSFLCWS